MPMFDIVCPCGNRETLSPALPEGKAICDACDSTVPRGLVYSVAFRGDFDTASSLRFHNEQLGSFTSTAAMDAAAERQGLVRLEGQAVEDFKVANAEAADAQAQRAGFPDAASAQAVRKDPRRFRDQVAAAREKQADKYHAEHGTEDRKGPDDPSVWRSPLPAVGPSVSMTY